VLPSTPCSIRYAMGDFEKEKIEEWTFGIDVIDAGHSRLLALIETAEAARSAGKAHAAVRHLKLFLKEFNDHFEMENRLLEKAGYPGLGARHSEFITSFSMVSAHPLDPNDLEQVQRITEFMRAWLTDHIIRQDLPLCDVFIRQGLASAPRRKNHRWRDAIGLRWRMILLGLLPLAVVLGLAGVALSEMEQTLRTTSLLREMNDLNAQIGGVVHELQSERGLAVMIVSDPRLNRDRLRAQISASDAALGKYRKSMARLLKELPDGPARDALENSQSSLELIPEVRGDVQDGSYDAAQTTEFYTTATDDLMAVVPEVVRTVMSSDFGKDTIAYVFLLKAKELAGRERALGSGILAGATPDLLSRNPEKIRQLAEEQESQGKAFEALVAPSVAENYRAAATVSPKLVSMRRSLENGETLGLTAQEWFDVTSERIDRIRDFETQVTGDLDADVSTLQWQVQRHAMLLGGGIVGAILLSLVMILMLGWSIIPPLRRLSGNLGQLAEGKRLLSLPDISSRDEIGNLARQLALLRDRLIQGDLLKARRGTENAERLRAVMDNLPGIVFRVVQSEGASRVVAVSSKFHQMTGVKASDVIDKSLSSLLRHLVHREDRLTLLHVLYRAGGRPLDFEFRLSPFNGEEPRWLRVIASPVRTGTGWIWDGVALDVTVIKQTEAQHAHMAEELDRVRRMQMATELGASIQAELSTLSRSMQEHAEVAVNQLPFNAPLRIHLLALAVAARKAQNLCERVQLLSGDDRKEARQIEVSDVIGRHLQSLSPQAVLDIQLEGQEAWIVCDPEKLEQLAANLEAYLRGSLGHDGDRLVITARLTRECYGDTGYFCISVKDNRPALTRRLLSKIMEPRFGEPRGRKGEILSLAIVQAIVDGIGGRMQARGLQEGGSLLEIFLPLCHPPKGRIIRLERVAKWQTRIN